MAKFDDVITVQFPEFNWELINQEAKKLADDLVLHVQSQIKIALVRAKAVATGGTLKSVTSEKILDSPSRVLYLRQIIASSVLRFIESGRRAGAPMPPEAPMIAWFRALGIPQRAWFPIRLSIARRGIKPRNIRNRALQASRPYIAARCGDVGRSIMQGLMKQHAAT